MKAVLPEDTTQCWFQKVVKTHQQLSLSHTCQVTAIERTFCEDCSEKHPFLASGALSLYQIKVH